MTGLDGSLDALRREMQQCRRCRHPMDVRPIISLARAPRIVLVGQAPGKTEAGGGHPFAGRAGRTLFQWLASVEIDEMVFRRRVQISAITRCYPGPSASGRGDRVPGPAERRNCSGWLDEELRLIRPALIVPVGRLAIDAFLGSEPLDAVIGREHAVALDDGRGSIAIPLPHPSGASSWIHVANHRALLDASLALIAARWAEIEGRGRRVA